MHHRASLLRRLLPLAVVALAGSAAASTGYHVVLASGARVVASSRPIVAMGKVSFLDENGRPVTLPSANVDVAATRASLGPTPSRAKVWNEKDLTSAGGRSIQFYGEDTVGRLRDPSREAPAETEAAAASDADGSPAERLRARIEGITEELRDLPTSDRQRSVLVIHQLELQQELTRLLDGPQKRG